MNFYRMIRKFFRTRGKRRRFGFKRKIDVRMTEPRLDEVLELCRVKSRERDGRGTGPWEKELD